MKVVAYLRLVAERDEQALELELKKGWVQTQRMEISSSESCICLHVR